MPSNNLKTAVTDLKKANKDANKLLDSIDKKLSSISLNFTKTKIKNDIATLKLAKGILEGKK